MREFKEVYYYSNVLSQLRFVVREIRRDIRRKALESFEKLLPEITNFFDIYGSDNKENYDTFLEAYKVIVNTRDYILVGDILESVILPIMEETIQAKLNYYEQIDDRYVIESTASGFLTIYDSITERYLHSNNDPMDEARIIVEEMYDYEKERYFVWGCGLGYHIYQLYMYSSGSIPIVVYEPNEHIIEYAKEYGVLSWVDDKVLEIRTTDDINDFVKKDDDENGFFILYPYINTIENNECKSAMLQFYMQQRAGWEASHVVKLNYYRNTQLDLPDISKINRNKVRKEWVVVGGGPSVDDSIGLLKSWKDSKTIIAVGTIWKRMIKEGINPDYVVFMDPYETVYEQILGCDDTAATLLVSLSTYWKCARDYKGEKYTICVDIPDCPTEQYAKKMELELWESGGTVTSLAIEVAIKFRAESIYLVGVDLAYPGEVSHAKGTALYSKIDTSKLITVESVNGGRVYTDAAFNLYREWIEYRIVQHRDIHFINVSNIGAKILGTEEYVNV